MKVLVTNPDDSGDTHQFWAYNLSPKGAFQDFAEWWTYIGGLMVMHGMELADEPSDGDNYDGPDYDDEDGDEEEEEPQPESPTIVQHIERAIGRIFGRR